MISSKKINQTSQSLTTTTIVDIAEVINVCRDDIDQELKLYQDSIRDSDVVRIIAHFITHSIYKRCEISKRYTILWCTQCRGVCDFFSQFNIKRLGQRILTIVKKIVPYTVYVYDGRFGNFTEITQRSGEYKEILFDINRQSMKRYTYKTAIKTASDIGLELISREFLSELNIKRLFNAK